MIRLYTQGDFVLTAGYAEQVLIGAPVYAVSDDNVTVNGAKGDGYCGILLAVIGTNRAIVRIQPLISPQVEIATHVPLASSTSGATTNPVLIAQRPIRIISMEAVFNTPPDQGVLNVGTGSVTPNEMVNNVNLATFSPHTPMELPITQNTCAAGQRVWAKVSQASSSAGVGGLLSVRYYELP